MFRIYIIINFKTKKQEKGLIGMKNSMKNGDNKKLIAILCKQNLFLRVKTILLA